MDLKEHYQKKVIPAMRDKFSYKNSMEVPKIIKVVLNVGLSSKQKEEKLLESARKTLAMVSGQKPIERAARKSISDFKIRKGQTIGLMVTLRGKWMYNFIERLVNLTFPRVRDFRGLDLRVFDTHGNATIGFRESVAFPEATPGDPERQHGMEVTVVTSAKNKEEGLELLKLMGFPFKTS